MTVTLNPNGCHPQRVGAVAATMAAVLAGNKKGLIPYVLWVPKGTTRETIEDALEEALRQARLPAGAIKVLRIDN